MGVLVYRVHLAYVRYHRVKVRATRKDEQHYQELQKREIGSQILTANKKKNVLEIQWRELRFLLLPLFYSLPVNPRFASAIKWRVCK
jgi:hypothetical protein